MGEFRKVKIGDFLFRIKRPIQLENNTEYKLVTVKLHHKGVVLRGTKKGVEIKSNMYQVKEGDFILSGIDARNGAFGIVPKELDGAIVTNDFWYFELDNQTISKEFLELTKTSWFDDICRLGSDGTTQRIRLQKDKFFNQVIKLPLLEEQKKFIKKFIHIQNKKNELDKEIEIQETYLKELKHSILQDAIEGKLTAKWREKNPNIESAKELLEKITFEKEQLIKDRKIKKTKILTKIDEDQIAFVKDETWTLCYIQDLYSVLGGKRIPKGHNILDEQTNHIYIRVLNMLNSTIEKHNLKYISEKTFNEIKNYTISSEDLYITIAGTIGRTGSVPIEFNNMNLTENAAKLCPISKSFISNKYILYCVQSELVQDQFEQKVYGMAMPKLAIKRIENTIIPLPPLEEQKQIVKEIEKLFEICDKLEEQISQNKLHAEQLMQSILKEAFEDKTQKENLVDEKLDKEVEISEDEIKQIFEECFIDKKVPSRRRQQSNNNYYMSKMIINDDLYGKSKNIRHIKLRKLLSKLYERFRDAEDIYVSTQLPIVGKYIRLLISGYSLYQDIDELATIKITPEQSLCLIVLNFYTYQLKEADGATNYEILKALETSYKKYVNKYKLDEQEIENILKYLQKVHLVENKYDKWIVKEEVRREFK